MAASIFASPYGFTNDGSNITFPTGLGISSDGMSVSSSGSVTLPAGGLLVFSGRSFMRCSANGLWEFDNNAAGLGVLLNIGTAAPTFNNGTVNTKSNNTAGSITLTGGNTGGTLTFGAPNWTNTPFIAVSGTGAADVPQITAISTSAFTIAGMTANGTFRYVCVGGL